MPRKRLRCDTIPNPAESDYFDLYSSVDIHEEMILDTSRTSAYQDAIQSSREIFHGKTVLDVGCGTCILTLFALKAGAAHVIAVDAAPGALEIAEQILNDNHVRDQVTLINSRVEDLDALPGTDHVDVIISEWMGYALLYESMLESVLIARDRWLMAGGVLFPNRARLHLAPFSASAFTESLLSPWSQPMYGDLDLSAIRTVLVRRLHDPQIMSLDPEQVLGRSCCLRTLDLQVIPADRQHLQHIDKEFELEITAHDRMHGLCLWFDVEFPGESRPLGTSPFDPETHWKQTVFFLDHEGVQVDQDDSIRGTIRIEPNQECHRFLDVSMRIDLISRLGGDAKHMEKSFILC